MRFLSTLPALLLAATTWAGEDSPEGGAGQFGQLFPSQQTACPETLPETCVCGEFDNLTTLPMRYQKVQSCPHPVLEGVDHVRTFTAAGAIVDDMMMKNGRLHGATLSWHPNGQVEAIANYNEGVQIGFARVWHDNGRPAAELRYGEGELHGTEIRYARDGRVEAVIVWDHGNVDHDATRRLGRLRGLPTPFDTTPADAHGDAVSG